MKKIYITAVFLLTAVFILGGCEKNSDDGASDRNADVLEEITTETAEEITEVTFPEPEESAAVTDGKYVFDDAGILSEKERAEIFNNTDYVSRECKVNCAVVTVSKLDGKSPSAYAEEYYKKLYSTSNGLMFLINNDTGEDYILRRGTPSLFITNSNTEILFAEISPLLVTEKYAEAADKVLALFAEKLPRFCIDRTNSMTKEEITAVDDMLAAVGSDTETASVIFIKTFGTMTVKEYAEEYYRKYFSLSSGSNALMVVNADTAEYYICGADMFTGNDQESIRDKIDGCLTVSDSAKTFNFQKAAEIFAGFLGK